MKNSIFAISFDADVVELVDTLDLGSSAARRGGSTPFIRTLKQLQLELLFFALALQSLMLWKFTKNKIDFIRNSQM